MADRSEELMERVQTLSAQLEEIRDPFAPTVAHDLVSAIMQLYGEGLERIFEALEDAQDIRSRLADDGVVASLLLLHGLYPVPLETRVQEALDSVRPYMESHGGDVELLGISEEGVAHLKLVGSCKGCPASQATLQDAIETAIEEAAPDLLGLEVQGVVEPPRAPAKGFELPMVQSNGNGNGNGNGHTEWRTLEREPPSPGTFATLTIDASDMLVANVGGTLLAYRDQCGGCGAPLARAAMTPAGLLTCGVCERVFDLRHAGRSSEDDELQIAPVPLLRGSEGVRVALAAG